MSGLLDVAADRETLLEAIGTRAKLPFTPENFPAGSWAVGGSMCYRIITWEEDDEKPGAWKVTLRQYAQMFKPELLVVAEGVERTLRIKPDSELTRIPDDVFRRLLPTENIADDLAPEESLDDDLGEEAEEQIGEEPPDLPDDESTRGGDAAADEDDDAAPLVFDVQPELMGKATTMAGLWNIIFDHGCSIAEEELTEKARGLEPRLAQAKPSAVRNRLEKIAGDMRTSPQRRPDTAGFGIFHVGSNWILSEDGVKPTSNARRAIASGAAPRGVKPPKAPSERNQGADQMRRQLEADAPAASEEATPCAKTVTRATPASAGSSESDQLGVPRLVHSTLDAVQSLLAACQIELVKLFGPETPNDDG